MHTSPIALITGAASGIGRSTARYLARQGAHVIVTDANVEQGTAVAATILREGKSAEFVRLDVTSSEDVAKVFAAVDVKFQRLDFLCNVAGLDGPIAKMLDITAADLERVLQVNLIGTFLCMQAAIRMMLRVGSGAVVNVASVAGLVGMPKLASYSASKHAVIGLTKSAALEYASKGIRINAVCPGGIDTPMLAKLAAVADPKATSSAEALSSAHPAARLGKPDEVASLIAYLCGPDAAFMNGVCLPVDGGYTAR